MVNLIEKSQWVENTIKKINEFFAREFWNEFDKHVMPWLNTIELLGELVVLYSAMMIAQTYVRTKVETIMLLGGVIIIEAIKVILFNVMRRQDVYAGFKRHLVIALDIIAKVFILSVAYDGSLHSALVVCTILICELTRIPSFILWHDGGEKNFVRVSQILTLIEVTVATIVILTV